MRTLNTHETKLTKIGNSQTIRIPKRFIERFFPNKEVIIEATEEGLLLYSKKEKISFKEAAIEMAKENEDWEDWDTYQNTGFQNFGEW